MPSSDVTILADGYTAPPPAPAFFAASRRVLVRGVLLRQENRLRSAWAPSVTNAPACCGRSVLIRVVGGIGCVRVVVVTARRYLRHEARLRV